MGLNKNWRLSLDCFPEENRNKSKSTCANIEYVCKGIVHQAEL